MHANNLQAQTPPKKAWIFDENWTKIPTKWRKRNTINLKERTDQRVNILERVSPLAIFMFTTRNWKSLAFILCASNIIVHSTERFMISIRYWKMRRAVWVNTFIVLDMSWRLSLEQHLRYGAAYSLLHSVCQREFNTCVCILFSLLSHELRMNEYCARRCQNSFIFKSWNNLVLILVLFSLHLAQLAMNVL